MNDFVRLKITTVVINLGFVNKAGIFGVYSQLGRGLMFTSFIKQQDVVRVI